MSRRPNPAQGRRAGVLARRFTVTALLVLSVALAGANAAAPGREATARTDSQPAAPVFLPGATAALGIRG